MPLWTFSVPVKHIQNGFKSERRNKSLKALIEPEPTLEESAILKFFIQMN
jgi:hypothetical protein